METRSRKRAEASSTAPSSSSSQSTTTTRPSKKARSFAVSSSSSTSIPPPSTISTRSRQNSRSQDSSTVSATIAPMDSESSGSAAGRESGSRRGKNQALERERDSDNKGKEPELRVREREREMDNNTDRSLGLSIDGGIDDDDNDSDGAVGILHQNLTSASSALQGLLRKLGAGLDDLLPVGGGSSSSHQNGRLKKILSGLRADGEEGRQVEALTQLCEMLSIGTEDSLSTFSVDSFVPVLVGLLNHESNADIMLLAARALTHLCDVLPSSCASVVHYGAVSCFCARLLTIEYMDLAEQSLQALKKISQEHPTACLRAGALMAVLSYLDFFSTGVQRVALSTAANMCKKLPSDASDFVMEAVPLLTNLLQYHDSKVLEHASVCLTRIAEAFASSPDKLDELCNHGLVAQAASLISISNSGGGQASLTTSTYTGLIRLLSTCASGSPLGAKTLLLLGISGTLKDILCGSGSSEKLSSSPALTRPADQIFEIVNLADELLPPLPQGTLSLPTSHFTIKGSIGKKSQASSSGKQDGANGAVAEVSAHEQLLLAQPELLQQFGFDLLPILTQIYGSSVNGPVRHKCLSVIGKLMYFSDADMIKSLLSVTNISSFLAGVLAWKDPQVLIPALQIAEILMEKLPETFSKMFFREGVVHAVDALIIIDSSNSAAVRASPAEKESDTVAGASSRSRRNRRRGAASNLEGSNLEELKSPLPVNIGPTPTTVEIPSANSSVRAAVSASAKAFKDKYFAADSGAEVGVTDDLLHIKNLCKKLNSSVDDQKTKGKGKSKASGPRLMDLSDNTEDHLVGIISELLEELSKRDGVSTFEFIGSGVVASLLNYFSCGTFSNGRTAESDLPKFRQQALKRFKSFIAVALPTGVNEVSGVSMSTLVQKLQNALSSLERFPVVLSHAPRSGSGNARLSSGLSALCQPIKLRLCRAQGEKSLRDYSSNILLIDPLASLAAVEEFLWPRVQRSEHSQKAPASAGNSEAGTALSGAGASSPAISTPASSARRHSTRSRSSMTIGGGGTAKDLSQEGNASSSKGKGKAVLRSSPDEPRGPQTRNTTRRRAASDTGTQMKPVRPDSSSEDEELDISQVDIDDALVIEEEDLSDEEDDDHDELLGDDSVRLCSAEKVHDVKLGDSAEDGRAASATKDSQSTPSGSSYKSSTGGGMESADLRSGSSFGTKGAMSFAAAAMAGLTSARGRGGRGIRGGRDRYGLPLGGSSNDPPMLIFSVGGKQLNRNSTIYQAIQRQLVLNEDDDKDDDERCNNSDFLSSDGNRLWNDMYTITYQRAENQGDRGSIGGSSYSATTTESLKTGPSLNSSSDLSWQQTSLFDSILQGELPCDLEKSNPTYNILALLRVLEGLNQLAPRLRVQIVSDNFSEGRISSLDGLCTTGATIAPAEFINSKLTPKLSRQIQDALALCSGSLPSWCYQLTKACPFLFPFETRRQYFYSTAFGLSRALNRLQQQHGAEGNGSMNEREVRVGRLQRQKVRVSRNRILDSAAKVMEMYSSQKAVLEVEYFGEVGTGLGPTLEFYTLLSHDLQNTGLGLWRSSTSNKPATEGSEQKSRTDNSADAKTLESNTNIGRDLIQAPLGLFPRPWPPNADASDCSQFSKVIEYFRLVGRVMAKALQDGRLLDLPLSTALYKLVLGQELDLHDILSFDADFGKILQELQVLVCRKQHLEAVVGNAGIAAGDLCFRGTPIEDLCLDFTLPGYPDYILKVGEENVDITNLEEYISLVVDATVRTGIMRQVEALRAGFNQVFDISSLQIFSPHELDYLLCGRRELWKPEMLVDHIKFDHGYTAKSPAVVNLLEIMGEFTPEQQRAFCQFVTGAPRLPPGGLAVLNPKLTIVRKLSSTASNTAQNGTGLSESADEDLPSVMTCANYLKLPPYSTKEIMYKKLLYAINEGQGSFDLS